MSSPAMELGQTPISPELATALARASEAATASGAGQITLEHLLYALCEDPDAIAVLDASRVDIESLRNETAAYVTGGQAVSMPVYDALPPSEDVTRIMDAAAAAARGGRRRDINGAIVIAAIVGDGRSFAAHLLHSHGLTFDEAIRALQRAFSPSLLRETQTIMPAADDVLARARERVQLRSAPTLRDMMGDSGRATPPQGASPATAPTFEPTRIEIDPATRSNPPDEREQPVQSVEAQVAEGAPFASSEMTAAADATLDETLATLAGKLETEPATAALETQPTIQAEPPSAAEAVPQRSLTSDSAVMASPSAIAPSWDAMSAPPPHYAPAPTPPRHPDIELLNGPPVSKYPPFEPQADGAAAPFPPRRPIDLSPSGPAAFDIPRRTPSVLPPPIPNSPHASAAPGARADFPVPTSPHAPWPELDPIASNAARDAALRPSAAAAPEPPAERPRQPNLGRKTGAFMDAGSKFVQPGPKPPENLSTLSAESLPNAPSVETGQLAENIPRDMRVGVTERAEVRIAKASVKAIVEGLEGGGAAWRHDVVVTKAMSVRLRAPDGGFFIETASPETQWIENNIGLGGDDFASWRFLITPESRGRSQLQIIVSARTVGADGVAAETALPDQVIDVTVRTNYKRALAKVSGWVAAAIAGGALARFGESGLDAVNLYVAKFMS
ncbi:MAG: Clp protease N-terminal domain-containing protein [Hyphomicrobium sp.]